MMSESAIRESRGSHLNPQNNTMVHLLPNKSRIHFHIQATYNVQHYNPMLLVLSVNSYQLIVLGCTPNLHLIQSRNSNDSMTFRYLLHSRSGN